jgi:phage terminase large subunit
MSVDQPLGPLQRLPRKLQPIFEKHRYKALHGGRGSMKSHTAGRFLLMSGAMGHERILCGREIQNSIRDSSKRLLDDLIVKMNLSHLYKSTDNEIRGPNDTLFMFRGFYRNLESIKGIEGLTKFWGDEARNFSQASIDILRPTLRDDDSEMIFTWNPEFATDPVDSMFRGPGGPPPDSVVVEMNYEDNPHFPGVLQREMEWDRARDIDKYNWIWKGKYNTKSNARVFKNWKIGTMDIPRDAVPLFGADWGFSQDPNVLTRSWVIGRTLYIDRESYGVGVELNDIPEMFRLVEDELTPDVKRWLITADSARPETISMMRNLGFNITGAKKGAGSVEDGVSFLKDFDIVVHPRCIHVVDELTLFSYKVDRLTGAILPVLQDDKNHTIDALRYALESTRRAMGGFLDFMKTQVTAADAARSLAEGGANKDVTVWGR